MYVQMYSQDLLIWNLRVNTLDDIEIIIDLIKMFS